MKARTRATQHQKAVKGGRIKASPSLIADIVHEVERQARKFGVSKSFVIAVALADQFGLADEQEQYLDTRTKGWAKPVLIRKRA